MPYQPDSVVQAQSLFFDTQSLDSPLADWARSRGQDFGETITPSYVYLMGKNDKPHTVAWLSRSGIDFGTGTVYSFYHLACDCMPQAELDGDMGSMFTCEALGTAIMRRAHEIRALYRLPKLLPADPSEKVGPEGEQIVRGTILHILERNALHPEDWVANYISGQHELPLLSLVLNREVAELSSHVYELAEAGALEVANESTIRLAQAA